MRAVAIISCPDCDKEVSSIAPYCPHCGRPIATFSREEEAQRWSGKIARESLAITSLYGKSKKLVAGTVIGGVLGVVGLLVALSSLNLGAAELILIAQKPILASFMRLSSAVGLLANSVLLIGVILSVLNHPRGPEVVRITCATWAIVIALLGVLWRFIVAGSELDNPTRTIGDVIGGLFQCGLIYYFFRESEK